MLLMLLSVTFISLNSFPVFAEKDDYMSLPDEVRHVRVLCEESRFAAWSANGGTCIWKVNHPSGI